MTVMGGTMIFFPERKAPDWQDLTGPSANNNGQFDKLTDRTMKPGP